MLSLGALAGRGAGAGSCAAPEAAAPHWLSCAPPGALALGGALGLWKCPGPGDTGPAAGASGPLGFHLYKWGVIPFTAGVARRAAPRRGGVGHPGLRLPPPQCGLPSGAPGPSSVTPGPGRSSWQPECGRCRPCWPWTQVGHASPPTVPPLLVPRGEGTPAHTSVTSASGPAVGLCSGGRVPTCTVRHGDPPGRPALGASCWLGGERQTKGTRAARANCEGAQPAWRGWAHGGAPAGSEQRSRVSDPGVREARAARVRVEHASLALGAEGAPAGPWGEGGGPGTAVVAAGRPGGTEASGQLCSGLRGWCRGSHLGAGRGVWASVFSAPLLLVVVGGPGGLPGGGGAPGALAWPC